MKEPAQDGLDRATRDAWSRRFDAVSDAQSKYLWTLLAVGVFYWVTQPDAIPGQKEIPVLGISLPADAIMATAAGVLFCIQLVIFGTMRAVNRADKVLKSVGGVDESIDYHSNAIDWAVYTTDASSNWVKALAGLGYAGFMWVFTAEATYFLANLGDRVAAIPHGKVLFFIAAFEAALVYPFLVMHTARRFERFWKPGLWEEIEAKILRGRDDTNESSRLKRVRQLPSPSVFAVALAIVGVLPSIRAPFSGLSLETALGTGLYVGAMVALGFGAIIADRQARSAGIARERLRENAAKERHEAYIALQKETIELLTANRDQDRARNEEERARDQQDRARLEAMVAKFGRGIAAEAKQEELVLAGRPRNDAQIAALAADASNAWNGVVQMYLNRNQYHSGTAAQLAAAAQFQTSVGAGESLPPKQEGR